MKPYGGKVLSHIKKGYLITDCRGRRHVESGFGIMSNKWKIFHKPINANLDLAILVVKTCCKLHNYVRVRDGINTQLIQDVMSVMVGV